MISDSPNTEDKLHAPILVTGAHRSGTTWVGKMLAASDEAIYISEPLNVLHRPGVLKTPVRHWYTYICDDNEDAYLPALREMLDFRYHTLREIAALRSLKDVGRMGRDWWSFLQGRVKHQRPLIKDPFAFFSAAWFARRFGCRVVITVRHPAGFVSSLKRLNWPFDLSDLLGQPLLMRDLLEPYRSQIEQIATVSEDAIKQNSLLWRLVYQTVQKFLTEHPDFIVVRHEDLSSDPENGFQTLYRQLNLNFTERARQIILASSGSENPKELSRRSVHSVRLDSRASLNSWKKRLSGEEINHIRQLTEDVATVFYPELGWD